MRLRKSKGQNTAEYAILIALIIGVAVTMQTYVKRSLQVGMKYAVDRIARKGTLIDKRQYEPYYLQSKYDTTAGAYKDTEETKADGEVVRTFASEDAQKTTTRSGYQKMWDVSKDTE